MNLDDKITQIYVDLLEHCPGYDLPAPFAAFAADPHVRGGPRDPKALLEQWAGKFTEDELLASGVVVHGDEGSLRLHPALSTPDDPWIALCASADGPPFDLLTRGGCLRGTDPSALVVLKDEYTTSRIIVPEEEEKNDGNGWHLYACEDVRDAVVLRAIGLPATTAHGLELLSPALVEDLRYRFGSGNLFRSQDDRAGADSGGVAAASPASCATSPVGSTSQGETPTSPAPPMANGFAEGSVARDDIMTDDDAQEDKLVELGLILVSWTPTQMNRAMPAQIDHVAAYLQELGTFLREQFYVATWCPSEKHLRRLTFALRHGDPKWVRDTIVASCEHSNQGLFAPKKPAAVTASPPADYAEAVSRLLSVSSGAASSAVNEEDIRRLRENVFQLLERDVLAPLMKQAMRASDPIERDLAVTMAGLSRMIQTHGVVIAQRVSQAFVSKGQTGLDRLPEDAVKNLLSNVSALVSLCREIRHCRDSSTYTPVIRPSRLQPSRSLFGSN